jgi:TPR repeat protein
MARIEMDMELGAGALAGQGQVDAFLSLGLIYASGRGLPVDLVEAHKWLNIAAARGSREAVARRAELACEMSRDDISRAQREARLWLTRH